MDPIKFVTCDGKEVLVPVSVFVEMPLFVEILLDCKQRRSLETELDEVRNLKRPVRNQVRAAAAAEELPREPQKPEAATKTLFACDIDRHIPDRTIRLTFITSKTLRFVCDWIETEVMSPRSREPVVLASGLPAQPAPLQQSMPNVAEIDTDAIGQRLKQLSISETRLDERRRERERARQVDTSLPLLVRQIREPICEFLHAITKKELAEVLRALIFFRMSAFRMAILTAVSKSSRGLTYEQLCASKNYPLFREFWFIDSDDTDLFGIQVLGPNN